MQVIVELIEDLNDYDDVDPAPGSGTKEVMAPPNSKHVLYQVWLRETHRVPRRGADLIEDWRTKEVRHAEANPTEAGS